MLVHGVFPAVLVIGVIAAIKLSGAMTTTEIIFVWIPAEMSEVQKVLTADFDPLDGAAPPFVTT